jgi:NAD(P)-dependent dehydrogenase (short-subunit alcohol dehydrogenase family)
VDLRLDGRAVIVTGGSSGIGRAIVELVLGEGAHVATCARSAGSLDQLQRDIQSSRLIAETVDVRDQVAMAAFVDDVAMRFGRLDGVVANAGTGMSGRVFDASEADWIDQLSVKILSVTNLVNPAVSHMRHSDAGRIVIMNSITAKMPEPTMAVVSAARAAVANLSRTLAMELAPDRICVNVINIGAIATERQVARFRQSGSHLSYEAWCREDAVRRRIALGRYGQAEEVAPIVALCLSPLSSYMTGATIDAHGG